MNLSARPRQKIHSYLLREGQLGDLRALQLRDGVSKSEWRKKEGNQGRLPRDENSNLFGNIHTTWKKTHSHRTNPQKLKTTKQRKKENSYFMSN